MKSRRSGAITRSVMRTWGLSVAAYFLVRESERYGSKSRCLPCHWTRNPLCPSHQRCNRSRSARAFATSIRKASSWSNGFFMQRNAYFNPSSFRTCRTPATMLMSFFRDAQRAVWLRPQSGAKTSRSADACSRQRFTLRAISSAVSM